MTKPHLFGQYSFTDEGIRTFKIPVPSPKIIVLPKSITMFPEALMKASMNTRENDRAIILSKPNLLDNKSEIVAPRERGEIGVL